MRLDGGEVAIDGRKRIQQSRSEVEEKLTLNNILFLEYHCRGTDISSILDIICDTFSLPPLLMAVVAV